MTVMADSRKTDGPLTTFVTRGEGTADIFVHMETLRRFGLTELRPGQFVQVRYGEGDKGLMAAEIHPDTARRMPHAH